MTDLSSAILEHLVTTAGELYSLPAVAVKVLELTDDPKVDTHALKECIGNDPALTTKILRVVNSSLFGLARPVSDLNQAIALLGIKPLKLLVLGFSLPSGLFAGMGGEVLTWYWRRTLTKAVAAKELCRAVWSLPGDDAFLAGLLQDLGMLLLIQRVGLAYVESLEKVRTLGADLLAVEAESLGFDHTLLSARLLAAWRLPEAVVEAVQWGALPEPPLTEQAAPPLSQIVHVAEWIARLLADGQPGALREIIRMGQERYGISQEHLEELVATLEDKVLYLADVLSLRFPKRIDYRDVLVKAEARLALVAADAAQDLVRLRAGLPEPEVDPQAVLHEVQTLSDAVAEISPGAIPASKAGHRLAPSTGEPSASAPTSRTRRREPAVPASGARMAALALSPPATKSTDEDAESGLLARLTHAVAACRQLRCPLSLLLVEINDPDGLVFARGAEGFQRLRHFLEISCRGLAHPNMICLHSGETGFALVLCDCDRRVAVQYGNQLVDRARQQGANQPGQRHSPLSLSVGIATVAMPPKNFPPMDLWAAADRCLYGSRASGGAVVKSIEIY